MEKTLENIAEVIGLALVFPIVAIAYFPLKTGEFITKMTSDKAQVNYSSKKPYEKNK